MSEQVNWLEREADRRDALRRALATAPGRLAAGADAKGFLSYVQACGIEWDALAAAHAGAVALVLLRLPGRVGVVLLSPVAGDAQQAAQTTMLSAALQRAAALQLNYLQALIEPEDAGRRLALHLAGFRHLTQLVYLERSATYPWIDPPGDRAEWAPFAPAMESRFKDTLLATYEGTLDCPELCGRRAPAEILAAHRASGAFDANLWELAQVDGRIAGCVLMHRVFGSDALEVAYMGVVPEFRRQGIGSVLLRRALEKTRAARSALLRIVVDARNAPARALYDRFGFLAIARREAYLRFLSDAAPRSAAASVAIGESIVEKSCKNNP